MEFFKCLLSVCCIATLFFCISVSCLSTSSPISTARTLNDNGEVEEKLNNKTTLNNKKNILGAYLQDLMVDFEKLMAEALQKNDFADSKSSSENKVPDSFNPQLDSKEEEADSFIPPLNNLLQEDFKALANIIKKFDDTVGEVVENLQNDIRTGRKPENQVDDQPESPFTPAFGDFDNDMKASRENANIPEQPKNEVNTNEDRESKLKGQIENLIKLLGLDNQMITQPAVEKKDNLVTPEAV